MRLIEREQEPPAQLPDAPTLAVPRQPDAEPLRLQALASLAAVSDNTLARADKVRRFFMAAVSFEIICGHARWQAVERRMRGACQRRLIVAHRFFAFRQRPVTGCKIGRNPLRARRGYSTNQG
ncbi:hypothetical protein [Bosea vaviloviae]|uniref:hypothetical protein n=1 Tax=Bosea vaviloviae TaxID=1526658 RepID=UPI0012E1A646